MASSSVELSYASYRAIVLHCAKYPASAVNGLLLGRGNLVELALPLQHHWNQLSPMVDVGLSLAKAYATSLSPQLDVIGVYYVPRQVQTSSKPELHLTAIEVGKAVASKTGNDAIALQVDNTKLGDTNNHALQAFLVGSSSQTKNLPPSAIQWRDAQTLTKTSKELATGRWKDLVDFDDHLEDTSLEWLPSANA